MSEERRKGDNNEDNDRNQPAGREGADVLRERQKALRSRVSIVLATGEGTAHLDHLVMVDSDYDSKDDDSDENKPANCSVTSALNPSPLRFSTIRARIVGAAAVRTQVFGPQKQALPVDRLVIRLVLQRRAPDCPPRFWHFHHEWVSRGASSAQLPAVAAFACGRR